MFSNAPGTSAPPSTLGPYTMTPFTADGQPLGQGVAGVQGPTGTLGFSPNLNHDQIGKGWGGWSNGYTGDVYSTSSGTITLSMPPATAAFYFYAQPSEAGSFTVNATNSDGTSSGDVAVSGTGGAQYFGFFANTITPLTSITVTTSDPGGFALGEFGVAQQQLGPEFLGANPPLTVLPGAAYSAAFTAISLNGLPAPSYSLASAPPWLSVDQSGNVTGTVPPNTTSFSYTVVATNLYGSANIGPYAVTVEAPLAFTQDSPPLSVLAGTPYSATFAASGFPAPAYALGGPYWLGIDQNGNVTGTPPAGTTCFSYSVTAFNAYDVINTGSFTVSVHSAPAFMQADPPLSVLAGTVYSAAFTASGLPAPTYTLNSAPSWLNIDQVNREGVITGTPPAGTTSFSYSVTATNSVGSVTTNPYTVTVVGTATVTGTVVTGVANNPVFTPVSGAVVQGCVVQTNECMQATTAADGTFSLSAPIGDAVLSAFPPTGSGGSAMPTVVNVPATGIQGEEFTLYGATTLPSGVLVGGTGSSPLVHWDTSYPFSATGCPNGIAYATVEAVNTQTGQLQTNSAPLTETPAGSGNYTGDLPPQYPLHGPATISDQITCAAPAGAAQTAVLPSVGAAGSPVLISGSGFTGASAVDFGAVPATSFTVMSDSLIEAIAPAGQGDATVTVTTPTGPGTLSGPGVFSYFGVTGVSPSSGPAAGGTTVTITGAGFTNADAVTFGTAVAASFSVVSDTEIRAVTPPGTGTVDVGVNISGNTTAATAPGAFTYAAGASGPAFRGTAAAAPAKPQSSAPAATGPHPVAQPTVGRDLVPPPSDVRDLINRLIAEIQDQLQQLARDSAQSAVNLVTSAMCSLPPSLVKATVKRLVEAAIVAALVALAAALAPEISAFLGLLFKIPGVGAEALQAIVKGIAIAAGVAIDALLDAYLDPLIDEVLDRLCHKTTPPPVPNAYIDPSGAVLDTNGNAVAGATVTLLRADTAAGPFTPLDPAGPGIRPAVNPQTTGSDGVFHWDVFSGWYELQATAPGCTDPNDPTQTSVTNGPYPVPPPQVGLTVTMACPGQAPPPTPTVTGLTTGVGPTAGGTSVSITGSGFTPASTVDFGPAPATAVTYLSAQELTVTSPPGSGPVDVTVTNATTTSTTSSADRFYFGNTPTVTGLSQHAGPTTGGSAVTITGSGFTGATTVTFGDMPAAAFTVVSDIQVQATTPANVPAGTMDVQVVTPAGVSALGTADQFTFTAGPAVDRQATATGTDTAVANFTASAPGDLIVAFVAGDGPAAATQKAKVTGGGLTWTLAKRTNSQYGTAEIWTARATGTLSNAAITSTLNDPGGYGVALTVVGFSDAAGTGQSSGASARTGAPTASLTTSGTDALVFGVGNDWTASVPRTLGPNQTLLTQSTDARGDTYWVQYQNSPATAAGTSVTINDTAPANDHWNLALIEID